MRKPILIILLLIMLLLISAPAALADDDLSGYEVRVLLKASGNADSYSITVHSGAYYIVNADDPEDVLAFVEEGDDITLSADNGDYGYSADGDSDYDSSPYLALAEDEDCRFSFNGSTYRGGFKVMSNKGYGYAINVIDLELYLYGVVGRELGYNYHLEATKAQAIASRSYALASCSEDNVYYDVSSTVTSQVYGGYSGESALVRQAVDETRGQVLMYEKEPVMAYFSSSAGGHTENVENVWVSDDIPLAGVESPHDAQAGRYSSYGASCYSWTVEYTPKELVALANAYGKTDIGSYKSISMQTSYGGQTSVSGRAMEVTIKGSKGSVSATKDSIRSLLDLKSTLISISDNTVDPAAAYVMGADGVKNAWTDLRDLFAINASQAKMRANGDKDSFYVISADGVSQLKKSGSSYDKIVISGKGYGHGVGMSQWGAIAMADDGYDSEEIIEHYYCHNGIKLKELY